MKYKAFLFIILASVAFFNPYAALSEQMHKLVFYLAVMLGIGVSMLQGRSLNDMQYPRKAYLILLASMFFSGIMATSFHSQSLTSSYVSLLPFVLAYCTFYVFMKLEIPITKIMNTYLVLCAISGFVYLANVATFPNNIFGEPILGEDTTRGIIRIPVVFIEIFPLVLFYAINQWLLSKRKRWFWVMSGATLMIVLSVIRQVIGLSAILGMLFLFRKVSWKLKLAMVGAVIAIVVWVLPLIPIYSAMIEISEEQSDANDDEEDIRIQSWRYFTYEAQDNVATSIFGNGIPSLGKSIWGTMFASEGEQSGRYAEDVGWAGFYYYYGIFATLALLYMTILALMRKKGPDKQFLNYWLVFFMITNIASGVSLYFWQILDICIVFYMCFGTLASTAQAIEPEKEDNKPETTPSYLPSYPQLNNP